MGSLRGDGSDHEQLLLDLQAMRIGGGDELDKTLLRSVMLNPHVHASSDEIRMTNEIIEFFQNGEAGNLANGPTVTFFMPGNLVRLFPVPRELGFLTSSMAGEHSGSNLTPGVVAIMKSTPKLLEIYSRGVKRVMDCFGVPLASQNPSIAATNLLKKYEGLGSAKWGLCCLFYRLTASTFFLDPSSHGPLVRFYCREVANKMAQNVTDTCGLRKALSYSQFIAKIRELSIQYGTTESDIFDSDRGSEILVDTKPGDLLISSNTTDSKPSSETRHEVSDSNPATSDSDEEEEEDVSTGSYAGTRDIIERAPCVFTLPRSEKTLRS